MAIDTGMLSADLNELVADLPSTITVSGTSYTVAASDNIRGESLQVDGIEVDFDISFAATVAAFTAGVPALGSKLYFDGKKHTVVRISVDAAGIGLILYCTSDFR